MTDTVNPADLDDQQPRTPRYTACYWCGKPAWTRKAVDHWLCQDCMGDFKAMRGLDGE